MLWKFCTVNGTVHPDLPLQDGAVDVPTFSGGGGGGGPNVGTHFKVKHTNLGEVLAQSLVKFTATRHHFFIFQESRHGKSVADPGFPRERRKPTGEKQLIIWQQITNNCMEMKEMGPRLDPPQQMV